MRLRTTFAATLCLASAAQAQGVSDPPTLLLINEIRVDQPGGDDDEYFELFTVPASATLDGLTYLVIGDSGSNVGVIEAVVDLTGSVSDAGGLFVAAEDTFTLCPADLETSLNFENGDSVTHLVVEGFSGTNGDDLDTDDDGTLDTTPWTSVLDVVGLNGDDGRALYAQQLGGVDVGPNGTFLPAHVFRCLTSLTDWRIGLFGEGVSDTPCAFNGNCVASTSVFCDPGAANSISAMGGTIALQGTGSLQLNDSALVASDIPNNFGVFVQAEAAVAPVPSSIGGNICIDVNVQRMNQIVMIQGNQATLGLDFADAGLVENSVSAGTTFFYQFFHRDSVFPGGGNYTNGIGITWAP
ncbi:MAG: hypothetical protein AAGA20_17860 [Planctomycetota bacterium]